ncbi:MAG: cytochrome c oxidase assembly protein [Pseudomonadota bacterium]
MKQSTRRRNLKVVVPSVVVIGMMLGLVAYSPTLYRLFCAATGFGGTTQRADSDAGVVSDRVITVRFDSNVAPGLPWRFEPVQREVKVHLGEQQLVFFTAENLTDQPIVGHSTFNVSPPTTGIYFNKIQCFCFDEERLNAHQKVDMPVVFFVDPALASDPETRDVDTITLSYTFFRSVKPEGARDLSRFNATAEPDAVRGQQLFGERCAACHALNANKSGPMLGGVFGRQVGAASDYKYSSALSNADLIWSADNLDRWLTDPRKFIVGARMPARVIDPATRRDIIAYLEKEAHEVRAGSGVKSVAEGATDGHRAEGGR